uniref:L-ectoine synthase n=1 Tax=Hyaloperonospora arabidopsidis (strain Emoy2) TaxID=559515 RepID=M4B337_HYAAE
MMRRLSLMILRPPSRSFHASAPAPFLVRSLDDVRQSRRVVTSGKHGALETRRYLVRNDECGFSLQQEILQKGACVRLEFQNHVFALLVTRGRGRVRLLDGKNDDPGQTHDVAEGSLVALNAAEAMELEAVSDELHAVSVMNPPLYGVEQKNEMTGVFPAVDADGEELESFDLSGVHRLFTAPESLKGGSAPMKDDPLF